MTTFLLVHGAWHGGWSWKKLTPLLQAAGHQIFNPTLTGLGERAHLLSPAVDLNTHIQDILGVLECEDLTGVVLVGHSYGGVVITAVAEKAPERLAHLVYLDAFVPQDGQSLFDFLLDDQRHSFEEQARTVGDGWRLPPPQLKVWGITADEDIRWMSNRVGDHPLRTFTEPVRLSNPAAAALPRTFISCTAHPRPALVATASRLRTDPTWRYRELFAGHDAMVTEVQKTAGLLLEAAA